MSFLWESVKVTAQMAGNAAKVAGQKTKLKGEVLLVDREITNRKRGFGVELYDYVAPLCSNPDFFAANDKMTDTIRGPMLKTQREIAALNIKRTQMKEKLAQAEVTRKAAFPAPAASAMEKVVNTGKAVGYAGNEAKLSTEISMIDTQITAFKQEFGLELYDIFVQLEDNEGWLPTIRDIRSMYDAARREVDKLQRKKDDKEKEIAELGGGSTNASASNSREHSPTPPTWSGKVVEEADMSTTNYNTGAPPVSSFSDSTPAAAPAAASAGYGSTGQSQASPQPAQQQPVNPLFGYPGAPGASSAPDPVTTSTASSTDAPYDPFSAPLSSQQQQQATAPGYDPFNPQGQPQPTAPPAYDPFSQPVAAQQRQQPAAYDPFSSSNNPQPPKDNDPFAGL